VGSIPIRRNYREIEKTLTVLILDRALGATDDVGRGLVARLVAFETESDQIFHYVVAELTPPLNVMDLKILHSAAPLATPAVAIQNFTAKLAISFLAER
jgi:hypothetical protein